jgi:Flp pilus assembly pilin Flp
MRIKRTPTGGAAGDGRSRTPVDTSATCKPVGEYTKRRVPFMVNAVSLVVSYLRGFIRSEKGQDLIEYAALGGLIAAALAAALAAGLLTGALDSLFTNASYCIDFDAGTECLGGI